MQIAARLLRPAGRMAFLVPASPMDWGIEDEIPGHYRWNTREDILRIAPQKPGGLIV